MLTLIYIGFIMNFFTMCKLTNVYMQLVIIISITLLQHPHNTHVHLAMSFPKEKKY